MELKHPAQNLNHLGFPFVSDCDSSFSGGWIMSAPLPFALRARFQQYIEEGFSGRAAALCLKLSPATGARWAFAIKVMGHAQPAPQGRPKGNGKLAPHRAFFEELIGQDADITLPELGAALEDATGERAHPSSIGKFLCKLGYTYKKRQWWPPSASSPV
jgi:transposase